MIAAACLVPLGAFAAMQARLDFLVQHHTRTALRDIHRRRVGPRACAGRPDADPRFDRLLAGPDRQAGTPTTASIRSPRRRPSSSRARRSATRCASRRRRRPRRDRARAASDRSQRSAASPRPCARRPPLSAAARWRSPRRDVDARARRRIPHRRRRRARRTTPACRRSRSTAPTAPPRWRRGSPPTRRTARRARRHAEHRRAGAAVGRRRSPMPRRGGSRRSRSAARCSGALGEGLFVSPGVDCGCATSPAAACWSVDGPLEIERHRSHFGDDRRARRACAVDPGSRGRHRRRGAAVDRSGGRCSLRGAGHIAYDAPRHRPHRWPRSSGPAAAPRAHHRLARATRMTSSACTS